MEIDRVQLVKGLKVERTGSEQERRRRPQTEEDFHELLDSSLDEEEQQEEKDSESQANRRKDTVSITSGMPAPPLACDLVSISTTGRVGAEVENAKRSVKNGAQDIERELKKRDLLKSKHTESAVADEDTDAADEKDDAQRVDTLA